MSRLRSARVATRRRVLPFQNLQACDLIEMRVARRQRQVMFHGEGCDPDVVLRNRRPGFGQRGTDLSVLFRSGGTRRQQIYRGEKLWISFRVFTGFADKCTPQ